MDLEDIEDNEDDEIFEEENEDISLLLEENKSSISKNRLLDRKDTKKITLPIMSSKEKCVVIWERWKQLDNNYKTTIPEIVKEEGLVKSYDIAIKEFELGKMPPYIIKRGKEEWKHEDFKYFPYT